jgi:hydrogenase maturation protein HypF
MIRGIARDVGRNTARPLIARRFHNTMAAIIADVCGRIREQTGIESVVLSGGVFMNAILATEAESSLRESGFAAYRHRRVPPNDGGLSLGQVAIAAAYLLFDAQPFAAE